MYWWDFSICDRLDTTSEVTSRLLVIDLVEENYGKNTDKWADKAERRRNEDQ